MIADLMKRATDDSRLNEQNTRWW